MVQFSARAADLKGSPIRGMLNVANQPGMISFAGGLPASDSFADIAIGAPPLDILQYGPTEGEPGLRQKMSEELAGMGLDCPAERILVLSGSQQGIDLVAKLMVDPGTQVAVEAPAYLAALQVFSFFGARVTAIDPAEPAAGWAIDPPSLAYVTPTFQNPTGRCWTAWT